MWCYASRRLGCKSPWKGYSQLKLVSTGSMFAESTTKIDRRDEKEAIEKLQKTLRHYNTQKQFQTVANVLDDVEKRGDTPFHSMWLTEVVYAQRELGSTPHEIWKNFSCFFDPPKAADQVLFSLLKIDPKIAVEFFQTLQEMDFAWKIEGATCSLMLHHYRKGGMWEEAVSLSNYIMKKRIPISGAGTYESIIFAHYKLHQFRRAIMMWRTVRERKIEASPLSYVVIFHCYAEAKLFLKAREVFEEIERKNIRHHTSSLFLMLRIYRILGDQKGLEELYKMAMSRNDIEKQKLYSAMISHYGKLGMTKNAEELFDEAKALSSGKLPKETYAAMITAYASIAKVNKAEEIFEESRRLAGVDEFLYIRLGQLYLRLGYEEKFRKLFDEMKANRIYNKMVYTFLREAKREKEIHELEGTDGKRFWPSSISVQE